MKINVKFPSLVSSSFSILIFSMKISASLLVHHLQTKKAIKLLISHLFLSPQCFTLLLTSSLVSTLPRVFIYSVQPPHTSWKHLQYALFEAESGLRCSYHVRETRALHPQGDWTKLVIQMRKHTWKYLLLFLQLHHFLLTTNNRRKHDRSKVQQTVPPQLRLWRLSQAWQSPG